MGIVDAGRGRQPGKAPIPLRIAGDDLEHGALPAYAVDPDLHRRRPGSGQAAQRSQADGKRSQAPLQRPGNARHHRAVEAKPRHLQKVARVAAVDRDPPQIRAPTFRRQQLQCGDPRPGRDAQLARPEIDGAARNHADRDGAAGEPVHDLAQCAVPTAADNHVRAGSNGGAGQRCRLAPAALLAHADVPAVGLEDDQCLGQIGSPPRPERGLVISHA